MSWNDLHNVEGLTCLGELCSLCELQMEGNSVCKSSDKCVCVRVDLHITDSHFVILLQL